MRRFRCGNDGCPRMIFAERFGDDIVAPSGCSTRVSVVARR